MSEVARIAPIEKPKSLYTRIAYQVIKRKLGKVITPAKVIYARYPSLFTWVKKMSDIEEFQVPIEKDLKLLIKYYVAWLNRCAFCLDIGEKLAKSRDIDTGKFFQVDNFRSSEIFSEREKAALIFAEAANNKHVPDEAFNGLKEHFDDKQIVGIAYIVATENFYNIMNHSLGINSDQLCSIGN